MSLYSGALETNRNSQKGHIMIRLERNILDQANTQLRALEDHVLDQDGGGTGLSRP